MIHSLSLLLLPFLLLLGCSSSIHPVTLPSVCPSCFITREGSSLYETHPDGSKTKFTFSGVNIPWLGEAQQDPSTPSGDTGVYGRPSHYRIEDVLTGARSMGATVVRSHTLRISTGRGDWHAYGAGWSGGVWPDLGGGGEDEAWDSMDYSIYRAGQMGLRLVIPLVDEWNYFHGGIHDFLGWRNMSQLDGVKDQCVCNMDHHKQDVFYTDTQVVTDFWQYVANILSHVNVYTGLAYRDDPAIMAWESGNELYYPSMEWTTRLGRYVKDELRAKQLFMDGKMVTRTGFYPELDTPSGVSEYKQTVDIVSSHLYPLSLDSLEETSVRAMEIGLPYVLGEIGWTDGDIQHFMATVESMVEIGQVTGSLMWSMFGHAELYGHVINDDGYTIYWPTGPEPKSFHHNNVAYRKIIKRLSDHMFVMSRREIPLSYEISPLPPVITTLECKVSRWVRIAFRGVAGAHLYEIFLDESPIAIIEDRQDSPTYIHNPNVTSDSFVTIRPLGYGEEPLPGTDSEHKECVFL